MIKAWYAEEEKCGEQQQQHGNGAEAVSPAAELLVPGMQQRAKAADAAGIDAEGVAGGVATAPSTAVATTKQSAQLELGASQLLQSSHSLADWHLDDKASVKAAAAATPPTAAGQGQIAACAAGQDEDEGAPLLTTKSSKQPLPMKAAAAGGGAACTAAEGTDGGAAAAAAAADGDVTIPGLLARPAVLVFMWRALIIGLGLGAIGNFLFL
jgi:hypothetical protein